MKAGWRLAAGGWRTGLALAFVAAIAAAPLAGAEVEATRDAVRERWRRLPPEKRRELLRLHERLQALPAAERKFLLERLRSLDAPHRREVLGRARKALEENALAKPDRDLRQELLRQLWESLPPAERQRLREMPPPERGRYLQEKRAGRRQDILGKLPPEERVRITKLPAEEQVEALRRWRAEETLRRTFGDPAEVERLRAMRPRRLAELLGVGRGGKVARAEKPEFLSEETWQRWLDLKPYERLRVLRHLVRSRVPPGG